MKRRFDTSAAMALADSLNCDEAFRHWARSLKTAVKFGDESCSAAIRIDAGTVSCTDETADVNITGDEKAWENALALSPQQGIYDVMSMPGMVRVDADPLLIAANAKAFTRLWKQLRCVITGEERSWDWNV